MALAGRKAPSLYRIPPRHPVAEELRSSPRGGTVKSPNISAGNVSNRIFPESGVKTPSHSLSHHHETPSVIAEFARLDRYRAGLVPYFLEKLKNTPDADRSRNPFRGTLGISRLGPLPLPEWFRDFSFE